jgi:hypothetical protein
MGFDIKIRGKVSKKHQLLCYANEVLQHFFKNRLKRTVSVHIQMCKETVDAHGKLHGGLCWGDRNTVYIMVSKGVSTHDLSGSTVYEPYDDDTIVELLTHELIHAKQFIRGEINGKNDIWRNRQGCVDCADIDYPNQPWEQEAFELEKIIKLKYWD